MNEKLESQIETAVQSQVRTPGFWQGSSFLDHSHFKDGCVSFSNRIPSEKQISLGPRGQAGAVEHSDGTRMKLPTQVSRSQPEGCHGNSRGYKAIVSFRVGFGVTLVKGEVKRWRERSERWKCGPELISDAGLGF